MSELGKDYVSLPSDLYGYKAIDSKMKHSFVLKYLRVSSHDPFFWANYSSSMFLAHKNFDLNH